MGVGKFREWLTGLTLGQELALPGGLPEDLGDLQNAVKIGALSE